MFCMTARAREGCHAFFRNKKAGEPSVVPSDEFRNESNVQLGRGGQRKHPTKDFSSITAVVLLLQEFRVVLCCGCTIGGLGLPRVI
jgi:hypothetical protein